MASPLDTAWRNYRETVIPNVSERTRIQTRLAFYAGAGEVFDSFSRAFETDTSDNLEALEAIREELFAFREKVKTHNI